MPSKKKKGKKISATEGKEAPSSISAEGKSEEKVEESSACRALRERVREAFYLFDREKENKILLENVGAVARVLRQFPTQLQLADEILPKLNDGDEEKVLVDLEKFEKVMIDVIEKDLYPPEIEDVLLAAFRKIDKEKNGYIDPEYFKELMTQMGEPMKRREVDEFLQECTDPETGKIFYEDYIVKIANSL